jgi:hypothetical protein
MLTTTELPDLLARAKLTMLAPRSVFALVFFFRVAVGNYLAWFDARLITALTD